jgi:hypothetical protein
MDRETANYTVRLQMVTGAGRAIAQMEGGPQDEHRGKGD